MTTKKKVTKKSATACVTATETTELVANRKLLEQVLPDLVELLMPDSYPANPKLISIAVDGDETLYIKYTCDRAT